MQNNLPLSELLRKFVEQDVRKVKVAVVDIDGILRGKMISIEKFRGILEKGFGFCDVVFGWDCGDMAYDNVDFTGWHTGYPDAMAQIDLQTFRTIPWEKDLPFFFASFSDIDNGDSPICPRSLLKKVDAESRSLGYTPYFSQEFEWFNFRKTSTEANGQTNNNEEHLSQGMFGYSILRASQHSGFFQQLFDDLAAFGVPLEGIHTETGPGVYEAAITYSEILEAADRAVLFKSGVKEIAHLHNILPCFMAKFSEKLPGCSGHIHQSLWNEASDRNLFHDDQRTMNILMEQYIAGQLYCLPFILPMYAPTVNSYKRLVEGAWAPTTITWAIDNRTTALRALISSGSGTRLETRVVGADANPYLAMAACLASGLYGIKNKLKLDIPATVGNGYADKKNGTLPANLWEATQSMKRSNIAATLFGQEFTDHFCATREWEWRQFSKVVTDWEKQRYMEII